MIIDSHAHLGDERLADRTDEISQNLLRDNLESVFEVGYVFCNAADYSTRFFFSNVDLRTKQLVGFFYFLTLCFTTCAKQ